MIAPFSGIKRPKGEAYHSTAPSTQFKHAYKLTSIAPEHSLNFTLTI
jgi:hypothetical protein